MLIRAAFVASMTGPIVRRSAVRVVDTRIVEVGTDLLAHAQEEVIDLPEHLLVPGLINAHVHLDLSSVPEPLPRTENFTRWLQQVIALRKNISATQLADGIARACAMLHSCGCTTIGDYVGDLQALAHVDTTGFSGRCFVELIANSSPRAAQRLQEICAAFDTRSPHADFPHTITPHTPFTLDATTLHAQLAAHRAAPRGPLAIHCAESLEEWELFTTGRGPLADFLRALDFEDVTRATSPVASLARHGLFPQQSLLIHANEISDDDVQIICGAHCTVVHCPQTHRYFARTPFALEHLRTAGIPIALGTDSLASNPNLDLLAELRLMHENFPQLAPQDLLTMVTRTAAQALAVPGITGTIAPGACANLSAFVLPNHCSDPLRTIIEAREAAWVLSRGRVVKK